MAQVPLAFSIHNFISSVGADAGFAAIIGLAVLVLLYFAHARETANLREEAALLTQRLMQAEARVAQLTRTQSAPQAVQDVPAPRPAAVTAVALPFAPAGVGAPALAAATRVVPLARVSAPAAPATPQPAPQPAPERQMPAQPAPAPQPFAPSEFERERAAAAPVAAPAAATVAGANGSGHDYAIAASPPPQAPPQAPPPRSPSRPSGVGGRPPLPPLGSPEPGRSRFGRGLALLAGVVVIAAVVVGLVIATSGGSSSPSSTRASRTTNAPKPRRPRVTAPFSASSVTVAVLNGTNVNQLAHRIAGQLTAVGYKEGNVLTGVNQSVTSTIVSYFPGAVNRTDALHVATALKLGQSSVQPVDQSTQQVACQGATPCTANVVVTVGTDLATS